MHRVVDDNSNYYKNMIMDVMQMNQDDVGECSIVNEEPNTTTTTFFDILKDSGDPLWDECTNHSKSLVVAPVFTIKSDYELNEAIYDIIIKWVRSILLEGYRLKENFHAAKSMMKPFGLGY